MAKNINLKNRVLSNEDRERKAITSGRSEVDCVHGELFVSRFFYRINFGSQLSYNLNR